MDLAAELFWVFEVFPMILFFWSENEKTWSNHKKESRNLIFSSASRAHLLGFADLQKDIVICK